MTLADAVLPVSEDVASADVAVDEVLVEEVVVDEVSDGGVLLELVPVLLSEGGVALLSGEALPDAFGFEEFEPVVVLPDDPVVP